MTDLPWWFGPAFLATTFVAWFSFAYIVKSAKKKRAPKARARITRVRLSPPGGDSYWSWRVEPIRFKNRAVAPRATYWVRWDDALEFADRLVGMERARH